MGARFNVDNLFSRHYMERTKKIEREKKRESVSVVWGSYKWTLSVDTFKPKKKIPNSRKRLPITTRAHVESAYAYKFVCVSGCLFRHAIFLVSPEGGTS